MIIAEAERLYGLGFGVHWIRKNSKAPVKEKWSEPTRDPIKRLLRDYSKGFGLGVKMGEASRLEDGLYLANIDVDIKSSKKRHHREARAKLEELFPNLIDVAPYVITGMGFRLFIKTKRPLPSKKLARSDERVKCLLPGSKITGSQRAAVKRGELTEDELETGWRIRPAWELEFMSTGKQVVLPPSIHPETGSTYSWARPLVSAVDIPRVKAQELDLGPLDRKGGSERVSEDEGLQKTFTPVTYDLGKLSTDQIALLVEGEGSDDRSADCFTISLAMVRAGYSDDEIISALTDRKNNSLAQTAYDHRDTKNRNEAAKWVRKYCLKKAKKEISAANSFAIESGEAPLLETEADVKRQTKSLVSLHSQFQTNKAGNVTASFQNTSLVLNHHAGDIIGRDEFAIYDRYLTPAPWGWEKGRVAGDKDDLVTIKGWISGKYDFAPSISSIDEILTDISLRNAYHPIRRELEALPEWDGVFRIDTWLVKYFEATKDPAHYVGDVFRKWLVASIMRTYQPGYKMDWMPVLEGPTGIGKGEFAKVIAGPGYHIDSLPSLEKTTDAALQLEGARIVEFEELSALKGSTNETIKGFISRQRDKVRRPYDKKPVYIERQCVFIGTTNNEVYLHDETGNRRYNPIRVGQLDLEQLKKDRNQLWAEAYWIYLNLGGESLYLSGPSLAYAGKIQKEKMVVTNSVTFEELIFNYLHSEHAGDFSFDRFSILSLFDAHAPLGSAKRDPVTIQAAATALKKLGATKKIRDGYKLWTLSK